VLLDQTCQGSARNSQAESCNFRSARISPLAEAARIAGVVHTSIVINETGNVKNLTLISGHMLAPSALQAIKKRKYKPFQVDGKTAAVQAEV
jgi:outer membrane biosynthesis protein TonB